MEKPSRLPAIGFGSPLIDHLVKVDDAKLASFGLLRGGMKLVDEAEVDRLHKAAGNAESVTGGAAANTMLAMARLGSTASFCGKIAADHWGAFFADRFRQQGVKDTLVRAASGVATGRVLSCITPDGERSFATHLGAAITMGAADLSPALFKEHGLVFVEGYLINNPPLIEAIFEQAKAEKCLVALDMASWNVVEANRDRFKAYLKNYVDIVFANEEESRALTGVEGAAGIDALADLVKTPVLKFGAKGSMVRWNGKDTRIEITPVKAIDTTGAGDLFAGGFLHAFLKGAGPETCLKAGSAVSREVVQVIGATLPDMTWLALRGEINGLLKG